VFRGVCIVPLIAKNRNMLYNKKINWGNRQFNAPAVRWLPQTEIKATERAEHRFAGKKKHHKIERTKGRGNARKKSRKG